MPPDNADNTVVLSVTPGEVLDDRWRIEQRIGQGAMGSVFRARDLEHDLVVAIKILAPEHCHKPKVLARFEREAELMTSIRHPNIVQLFGHGRRSALPYIAMEYLEGMTLSEVLTHRNGRLGLGETVAVVKHIASGLAFLHHYGLVHRDVKPQNIFVSAGGRITILDLGVVRDQANPGLTRPGAMVGTPYYMSPEQILGQDDIDRRTDVYALSAMTFELLTGRPPFLGASNFEVLYGHRNTPPPDASLVVKTVTPAVAEVLTNGLAKERTERPESASEFAANLEAMAGVPRVDLARAFDFVTSKKAQKRQAAAAKPGRPTPSALPMASAEDVISVSGKRPKQQLDFDEVHDEVHNSGPTSLVAMDDPAQTRAGPEDTFVGDGPQPAETDDDTGTDYDQEALNNTREGQLRVVVLLGGQPIAAAVRVDRVLRGPSPRTMWLSPGVHVVSAVAPGVSPVERTVKVSVGTVTNLKIKLE